MRQRRETYGVANVGAAAARTARATTVLDAYMLTEFGRSYGGSRTIWVVNDFGKESVCR